MMGGSAEAEVGEVVDFVGVEVEDQYEARDTLQLVPGAVRTVRATCKDPG